MDGPCPHFLRRLPVGVSFQNRQAVQKPDHPRTGPALGTLEMLLLLLPLLWAESLQKELNYKLQVQESVTVQEGLCVRVPCTVTYPQVGWNTLTPAHGYWFRKKENGKLDTLVATNKQTREERAPLYLAGDPAANDCSLNIAGIQKKDAGKYYFRLERGRMNHSYLGRLLKVTVTDLKQTPNIQVKSPLVAGSPGHLTCSMPGACGPLTTAWMGAALWPLGLGWVAYNSSEIRLIPRAQDHGTNLTCQVTILSTGVNRKSTIQLNVSYAPQNLTIGVFRRNPTELEPLRNGSFLPVREGDCLSLLCVVDSNPPATLSWARGSRTLSPSPPGSPGVLQLPQVELRHEGEFTCRAQHPRGSLRVSVHLSVVYPPQLLGPSCFWEDEGLTCSCSSRAQPGPSLRWRLGGTLLEGSPGNISYTVTSSSAGPWANSSLSLRPGLSAGLQLSCETENVQGHQSASVLLLPGKSELGRIALAAVGGAGVVGLLSLCLCFIFKVKTCRRNAPEAAAGGKKAPSMLGPSSWGSQYECPPRSLPDLGSPAVVTPASGEELELYYASLSFHGLKPWEPRDQEATTEYAEISIHN